MRCFGAVARSRIVPGPLVSLAAAALLAVPALASAGAKWPPISADEKAASQSAIDPEAGAEVLHWTIHIVYEWSGPAIHALVRHELRVKVFTASGAQEAAAVEIPHEGGVNVGEIAARTVRPDGSVVELTKDQIFERETLKTSGRKEKVTALALPSVVPGSILDYRWTEIYYDDDANTVYLDLQRLHPVRQAELYLKPLPLAGTDYRFKMRTFNMPTPRFEDMGEYQKAALAPIPGWRDERYVPPRRQISPWAVFYFTMGEDPEPGALWKDHAVSVLRWAEPEMEAGGSVKAAAKEIAAKGSTPGEKADLICDWIRTHVDNVADDRLALSETERKKEPKNRGAADTLKRRRGTRTDIVCLFVAMCRGAGLDARLAAATDRSEAFFDQRLQLPLLLDTYCAAVSTGSGWRFYDPSRRWLFPGMMGWYIEGVEALLLDKAKPEFVKTPLAPPESSLCARSANLRLSADGSVEGTIRVESAGHEGVERHEIYDDMRPEGRPAYCRTHFPMTAREAALDSVHVDGADDPAQHLVERATIRMAGYAQPAGDRLLVPLSFFESGGGPFFTAEKRQYPIYFSYPWAYRDTVTIEIPEGYELEALPEPEPLVAKGVTRYEGSVLASIDGRKVMFFRDFSFGEGDAIYFPPDQYPAIKRVFEGVRQRDDVTLSLRRKP